jgi:multidrug transporter EmrE-like cation transporter
MLYEHHLLDSINEYFKKSWMDELILMTLLIVIIEQCAQNSLQKSTNLWDLYYILGLVCYILVGWVLHYAYNNYPTSKINVIWSCSSIILSILLGYILYNDTFSVYKIFAIIFSILAILCIQ